MEHLRQCSLGALVGARTAIDELRSIRMTDVLVGGFDSNQQIAWFHTLQGIGYGCDTLPRLVKDLDDQRVIPFQEPVPNPRRLMHTFQVRHGDVCREGQRQRRLINGLPGVFHDVLRQVMVRTRGRMVVPGTSSDLNHDLVRLLNCAYRVNNLFHGRELKCIPVRAGINGSSDSEDVF